MKTNRFKRASKLLNEAKVINPNTPAKSHVRRVKIDAMNQILTSKN